MPVYNEAAYIRRSLGAVLAQDYPASRLEIIVTDGMSDDGTREIVQSLQAAHPNLHAILNPGRLKTIAVNLALDRAQGEVVIVVDGHCVIAPDYVRRCVAHLQTGAADVVGGYTETVGESPRAQTIAIAMSTGFGVGDAVFRTRPHTTRFLETVPFPAYTRPILQLGGPFDEELAQDGDAEYNYRLKSLGAKILMAADVRSRYYARSALWSLWRQYFIYGFWKIRLLQMHPRQMRPRQFAPPLLVLALLGAGLLAPFSPLGGLGLIATSGAYCAANLAASTFTAARRGWQHLPVLPLAYATLHLAYGLGFWAGLFRFWNRWGEKGTNLQTWPKAKSPLSWRGPSSD